MCSLESIADQLSVGVLHYMYVLPDKSYWTCAVPSLRVLEREGTTNYLPFRLTIPQEEHGGLAWQCRRQDPVLVREGEPQDPDYFRIIGC